MSQRLLTEERGKDGAVSWSSTIYVPDSIPRSLFVWGTFAEAEVIVATSPGPQGPWFSEDRITENTRLSLALSPGVLVRVGVVNATERTRISAEYV